MEIQEGFNGISKDLEGIQDDLRGVDGIFMKLYGDLIEIQLGYIGIRV